MSDSTAVFINLAKAERELVEIKQFLIKQEQQKSFLGIRDDYWTHFILPVLIPLLLSVIGFLIGRWYSLINDKRKKLKDLKEKERFLFIWIDLIHTPITRQASFFKDFSAKLRDQKLGGMDTVHLHIDKLEAVDSTTLASLLVTNRIADVKYKNSLLLKFQNTVDYIKRKDEATKKLVDDVKSIVEITYADWDANYLKLQKTIFKIRQNYESLSGSEEVLSILSLFSQNFGKKDIAEFATSFVEKAKYICSDYVNLYPKEVLMSELMENLQLLSRAQKSKQHHLLKYADIFEQSGDALLKSYQDLVSIKEKMSNLKYKNYFNVQ